MSYIEVPLDNGHTWGLSADEIIIPGGSLAGLTAQQIGDAVLALAHLTRTAHALLQDGRAGHTLEEVVAMQLLLDEPWTIDPDFLLTPDVIRRKADEQRDRESRREEG